MVLRTLVLALCLVLTGQAHAQQLAAAPQSSAEIAELRAQVRALMDRINELEKKQAEQAKTIKPPSVETPRSKLSMSGYAQMRMFHSGLPSSGATPTQSFSNRRTRLAMDYRVSPRTRGFIQTDFSGVSSDGSVSLRDAYIDVDANAFGYRIGQQKFPLVIETDDNDLVVWTLERALTSTRLMPNERDRGVMFTLRDKSKDALPLTLSLGALNGNSINVGSTLAAPVLFGGLHYDTPRLEARLWAETGEFKSAAPSPILRGPRQRLALSARANLGNQVVPEQGKFGYRFSLMGAWARGRGDYPSRNNVNAGGLLTAGSLVYTANPVGGWYVEPVWMVTKDPFPIRLIGRYEVYDTNRDAAFSKIHQSFTGLGFDVTKSLRFIAGYTFKTDQTLNPSRHRAITLETQLAF